MLHTEDLCYLYSVPSVIDVVKYISGIETSDCAATLLFEVCIIC